MKIFFIKPNMIAGTPGDSLEPLVFAILSALTPPGIERRLYDERVEPIPLDKPADLVALTADAFSAKRAYQIAGLYRERGVPVVLGGYHPTLCPDEARQYADSIVLGDAEDTWPQILADVGKRRLRQRYVSAFSPALMTPGALTETAFRIRKQWNSPRSLASRFLDTRTHLSSFAAMALFWSYNRIFRSETFKKQDMRFGYTQ